MDNFLAGPAKGMRERVLLGEKDAYRLSGQGAPAHCSQAQQR